MPNQAVESRLQVLFDGNISPTIADGHIITLPEIFRSQLQEVYIEWGVGNNLGYDQTGGVLLRLANLSDAAPHPFSLLLGTDHTNAQRVAHFADASGFIPASLREILWDLQIAFGALGATDRLNAAKITMHQIPSSLWQLKITAKVLGGSA